MFLYVTVEEVEAQGGETTCPSHTAGKESAGRAPTLTHDIRSYTANQPIWENPRDPLTQGWDISSHFCGTQRPLWRKGS